MTQKFYRKIAKIDAFQWGPGTALLPAWFTALKPRRVSTYLGDAFLIEVLFGRPGTVVLPGDWVTRDHIGEIDVVPDSIFHLQHEPAA